MNKKIILSFFSLLFPLQIFYSILAQPQGWSEPVLVSSNLTGIQRTPHMDLTNDQINVVWTNYATPILNHEVFMVERLNGNWSSPLNISQSDSFPSSIPRVLVEQNDDLHLFWGDRTDTLSPRPVQQPDHLLYKNRVDSSFSQPETLLVSYHPWSGIGAPEVSFNALQNMIYLFLPPPPDTISMMDPQFLFFKRDNNYWSNPVKVDTGGYPNAFITNDDRIHLAYIHAVKDTSLGTDRNSVFYIFSNDNGATWSNRVVVDTSGFERPAFDPQIVVNSQGEIHTVFARSIDGDLFPDLIFHRKSNDGIQWTLTDSFPANYPGDHYPGIIALDSMDRIHLMWFHYSFSPQYQSGLYYSLWDGVSWSQPQFLFPVGYWEDFHFKIYNDIIHLVWAGSWNGVQGIYYTWKDAITGINQSADAQQNASITIKNFPNPFNDETNIQYKIYRVGKVKIEIFNIIGEKVQTLVDEVRTPGTYNAKFYANELSSGIYLCQISAETEKKVVKLFLVK